MTGTRITQGELESYLWGAATLLRAIALAICGA